MSHKVGLILSMVFVSLCFLFGADLLSLQSVYSTLDAKANNISYLISKTGIIDKNFIRNVQRTYSVDFACPLNQSPYFGEEITFVISTTYQPLVITKKEMTISISRVAVVGFYG